MYTAPQHQHIIVVFDLYPSSFIHKSKLRYTLPRTLHKLKQFSSLKHGVSSALLFCERLHHATFMPLHLLQCSSVHFRHMRCIIDLLFLFVRSIITDVDFRDIFYYASLFAFQSFLKKKYLMHSPAFSPQRGYIQQLNDYVYHYA